MRSHEHRAVGDIATDGAMVNLAGDSSDEALWLTFGDVVALSGDFFPPDVLFARARIPGHGGTRLDTSDELVAALKVATVDEVVTDPRFEPGGDFGHFAFSPRADRTDVERAVRDRYLALAAVNDDHFVAPGPSDARTGSGFPSAPAAYRHLHRAGRHRLDHERRAQAHLLLQLRVNWLVHLRWCQLTAEHHLLRCLLLMLLLLLAVW